jgi:hypothetical protein
MRGKRLGFGCRRGAAARVVFALLPLFIAVATARAAAPRRVAVLVGANAPALGRQPLRYAHRDAAQLGQVLLQVGGFAAADVHVLNDPPPEAVVALLEKESAQLSQRDAAGGETLLFFYYSGHADAEAIYPGGLALPLQRLRALLGDSRVTVRVGLIDACRGGGWTRTKGLSEAAVFELPAVLSSEGTVLISSSSGVENAHESEQLRGSFFSHHFMAALLGAADQTGDGEVSLNEAFEYAKQLTIRDTARLASAPQHPSFEVQLRGRRDLVLSRLRASLTAVRLEQEHGPLEIVALQSGQVLAETQPGRRAVTLALPPGHYLARRPLRTLYSADEFDVAVGSAVVVRERDLQPIANGGRGLRPKGGYVSRLPLDATTVESGVVEVRVGLGLSFLPSILPMSQSLLNIITIGATSLTEAPHSLFTAQLNAYLGITSRLQWLIGTGAFAYRLGQRGRPELVLWGGMVGWGPSRDFGGNLAFGYRLGLGLDLRLPVAQTQSILLGASAHSSGLASQEYSVLPTTWRVKLDLGYRTTVARKVTFNLAMGVELNAVYHGRLPDADADGEQLDLTLQVGSVQALGMRALPLVQFHLNRWLSIDGYLALQLNQRSGDLRSSFALGATLLAF